MAEVDGEDPYGGRVWVGGWVVQSGGVGGGLVGVVRGGVGHGVGAIVWGAVVVRALVSG